MLDPTTGLQPIPGQTPLPLPLVEADPSTQRHRLLMLARGLAFQMQAHLSHSGGGVQGVLVRQLAQQGVARAEAQIAANSDSQTRSLTSFLRRITLAVCASDSSDEQFIAEFEAAYAAVTAAFADGADTASGQ